jgi:hypothetical protein
VLIYHRDMRHSLTLILVCGGCGFGSRQSATDAAVRDATIGDAAAADGAPIDAAGDAPPDVPGDAVVDASPDGGVAVFCDPADPRLVACYQFEGDAKDGSAHHLDASMVEVSFVPGRVGQAMQLRALSVSRVADSPALDIPFVTIEAWINLLRLPARGQTAFILDVNDQYAMFVGDAGELGCLLTGSATVKSPAAMITTEQWHHVACTLDRDAAAVYVNGAVAFRAAATGMLDTKGLTGLSLGADNPGPGAQLAGAIDEVRLMSAARTAAEICSDADLASCEP